MCVKRAAVKTHNDLEKQNSIHREAINSRHCETIVPFYNELRHPKENEQVSASDQGSIDIISFQDRFMQKGKNNVGCLEEVRSREMVYQLTSSR
jgi:hypothetical protein